MQIPLILSIHAVLTLFSGAPLEDPPASPRLPAAPVALAQTTSFASFLRARMFRSSFSPLNPTKRSPSVIFILHQSFAIVSCRHAPHQSPPFHFLLSTNYIFSPLYILSSLAFIYIAFYQPFAYVHISDNFFYAHTLRQFPANHGTTIPNGLRRMLQALVDGRIPALRYELTFS